MPARVEAQPQPGRNAGYCWIANADQEEEEAMTTPPKPSPPEEYKCAMSRITDWNLGSPDVHSVRADVEVTWQHQRRRSRENVASVIGSDCSVRGNGFVICGDGGDF